MGPLAATCAALALELGWVAGWLASWSPIHIASFAWMPVALWRTERLIERPGTRTVTALAVALTLQNLPGFFQLGFFTCQVIALRVLWACMTRAGVQRGKLVGATGIALLLPLGLGAVQLFPSIEVALQSLRGFQLSPDLLGPPFSWGHLVETLRANFIYPGYAIVLLLAFASVVRAGPSTRRESVAFYWAIALLYFVLSLGPGSLPYDLYERLPFGRAFRDPRRLVWVTNVALAVLAGWGAQALLAPGNRAGRLRRAALLVGGALLLFAVAWPTLGIADALLAGAVVTATILADEPRWRGRASLLLPASVVVGCLAFGRLPIPLLGLRSGDLYSAHAALFDDVRARLTPQDRVLIAGRHPDFSLMPKSASLFRLPSIFDYETQAPRRYVDFFTYMRTGHRLHSIHEWYWIFDKLLTPTLQRRLLDVTATRYLLVDAAVDTVQETLHGGVRLLTESDGVRVYENLQALPRARFVPRVVVAEDDDEVLAELADSPIDPREVAWVAEEPPRGLPPADAGASGSAEIVADMPERVSVRVQATERGFLFLADQYFPGWTAAVNGEPRKILRADHTFRLVEVPAGASTVVFTYRPFSVRLGVIVSLATLASLGVLWYRGGGV
jgi:hypothetical protein